jgi:hypothetical protein
MNEKTRFDSIQQRAVSLAAEGTNLRLLCNVPDAATQTERAKCFKARLLAGLVTSNAQTAFFTLRKGVTEPAQIAPRDYETFLERVTGIASAEGLACDAIADGIMLAAEILLGGAEQAATQARELLS